MEKEEHNPYNPYNQASKSGVATNEGEDNNLAVASLILGVLSILFYIFTAIPGIVTGHMARSRQKKMPELYSGKGMALGGLILSYIMFVISISMIVGIVYLYKYNPEMKEIFMDAYEQELNRNK